MIKKSASIARLARPGRSRRGSLMIMVLMIALGLVTVTLYFADTMSLEYRGANNSMAGYESVQASEGARRYLISMLGNLQTKGVTPEITTDYEGERVAVGENAAFWLIGRDPNDTKMNFDRPVFGLVPEASKININTAPAEVLELLPGMTPELASEIVDWRDEDDDTTNGAESDIYMTRNPPYLAKNFRFESPDELRHLAGMTYEILYGEDANRNGILDPNENDGAATPPFDNQDGKLDPGIIDYVTVWSREPNTQSDGTARLDVTTSQTQDLQTALTNVLGNDRGAAVLQAAGDLSSITSLLEFYVRSGMTASEWVQVEDKLTSGSKEYNEGLINVATAPVAVLACIPGIEAEGAAQIAAYRQGKTQADLASLSWVPEVLGTENVATYGRYLTTRSYQYSADVVSVGQFGRGMHRDLYILETADSDTPRVIYRRDLSRLGWPLGAALREELRLAAQQQQ